MRKLIVIALTIVLALGLSVGVASAWDPDASADWSSETSGFSYGNFKAGGTVFGSSPGYPGLDTTGYMVEAGVYVTAGEADPGIFELVSFGGVGYAQTRLIPARCSCEGTWGKTIEGFQHLQQTEIVTGDRLIMTEMYSSIGLTGYPIIRMIQKVNDAGRPFPPAHVDPDQTAQVLVAYGDGPGYASMYTAQYSQTERGGPAVPIGTYGLLGADLAGGDWGFEGWQIVDYTPDGGAVAGDVNLWGTWPTP